MWKEALCPDRDQAETFLICHRWLPGLMTTHMNLPLWLHAALPLRAGPFCVPAARIRSNVTRDRRGVSECKLPHCSTVGPASPSDWLPAVELMVEGWNGERRLGNLIINVLRFFFFLKPLSSFFSLWFSPSLSLPAPSLSAILPDYWINDEIQSGSAITPVFCFHFFFWACVTASHSYLRSTE